MPRNPLIVVLFLSMLSGWALGQPGSAGALDAIKQSFRSQETAAKGGHLAADMAFYDARNDQQKKLARSIAAADVASARLQTDVAAQFGKDLGDAVAAAAGTETSDQIDAARDKVDGDRATIWFTHPAAAVPMILVQGRWKVSLTNWLGDATPGQLDQLIETVETLTRELGHVANLVEHQKFRSGEGVRDRVAELHDKLFGAGN